MIGIFNLYEQLRGRVNAHQGGHIRPYDFVEWAHSAQMEIYNDLVKEFQKSQVISDRLTPFLVPFNAAVTNQTGQMWDLVKKPAQYENYASARIVIKNGKCVGVKGEGECENGYVDPDEIAMIRANAGAENCEIPVELIDNDRWASVCNHPRKKVTAKSPKMTQFSGGFRIVPKGVATNIIIDCFRLPAKPVFNYVVINPGLEGEYYQFVPTGSVDLEWSEQVQPEILEKLIQKYAIFTANQAINR